MTRVRPRWCGVLAAVLLLWLLSPAAAADSLVVTEPQDRQELQAAPGWVTLAFDTDVDPGSAKVLVQDDQGRNVTVGQLIVEGTNVTTQLEDGLPTGTYTVRYRVVASDEPFGGAYQFSYGQGAFTDLPDRQWSGSDEEPPVLSNDDPNATAPAPPPSARPRTSEPGVEVSRGTGGGAPTTAPATTPTPSSTGQEPTASPTGAVSGPVSSSPDRSDGSASPSSPASSTGPSGWGIAALLVGAVVVVGAAATALVRRRHREGRSE